MLQSWVIRCGMALACAAAALAPRGAASAPLRVVYPAAESSSDARRAYPSAVLRLALEHAGRPFVLQSSQVPATQERALRMVATGDELDVVWTVPTDARERALRAVRFPIDRGLIGWRVLLVRRGHEASFAQVRTAAALAPLRAAQGHDWPDLPVLRHAGLDVHAGTDYDGLFAMLARGRIDYLPRSVLEVGDELARPGNGKLAIEPRLLLRYPSALYFFVNRRNVALATALEQGLARADADGCLDKLFHATYDEVLAPLRLPQRTVIQLANPVWTPPPRSTP